MGNKHNKVYNFEPDEETSKKYILRTFNYSNLNNDTDIILVINVKTYNFDISKENIQENIIFIKSNGVLITNNLHINKNTPYCSININRFIHNTKLLSVLKKYPINKCIYLTFKYDNFTNHKFYLFINLECKKYGTQSIIYQINKKYKFIKTFCFYNTEWFSISNGNTEQIGEQGG